MNIRDIQAEIRSVAERMQRLEDYWKSLCLMEQDWYMSSRHTVSGADKALESEGQQAISEEHERRRIN
jgi:hypothetical protein